MASFGRRMFPMFAMAAIAIVIASGVSFAQFESDGSASEPRVAHDGQNCAPVHHAPIGDGDGDCATSWQMLWGSKN